MRSIAASFGPVVRHMLARSAPGGLGLSISLLGVLSGSALGQQAGFYYIGSLGGPGQETSSPSAIGPGPTVIGTNDYFRNNGNFRRAYTWTTGAGMNPLVNTPASGTSSGAYAISADGSVLIGVLGIAPGAIGPAAQVFRRINGGPDEILPLVAGMTYPQVRAVSSDGMVTAGYVNGYGGGGRAVTWTSTNTAAMLPNLPGAPSSQALGISANGAVVVGWSGQGYPFDNVPARWVNGQVESLGLPPECNWAWAFGASADGSVVVGLGWVTGGSSRAFKWTPQTGMTLLDGGPTGFAEASSVSDDGRLIGGRVGAETVVWRDGVRHSVQAELIPAGTVLAPFTGLTGRALISHDGRFIAGSERMVEVGGDAEYHSWAVILPESFGCTAPAITQQPARAAACPSGTATFAVASSGSGPLTFRWRHNSTPLDSGANPSAATSTLSIPGPTALDAGSYDCIVSNACGTATSDAAELVYCYANCDCSTGLTVLTANDFQCFLNEFVAGSALANCDGSTNAPSLTANDFQCFINAYVAGCP